MPTGKEQINPNAESKNTPETNTEQQEVLRGELAKVIDAMIIQNADIMKIQTRMKDLEKEGWRFKGNAAVELAQTNSKINDQINRIHKVRNEIFESSRLAS